MFLPLMIFHLEETTSAAVCSMGSFFCDDHKRGCARVEKRERSETSINNATLAISHSLPPYAHPYGPYVAHVYADDILLSESSAEPTVGSTCRLKVPSVHSSIHPSIRPAAASSDLRVPEDPERVRGFLHRVKERAEMLVEVRVPPR